MLAQVLDGSRIPHFKESHIGKERRGTYADRFCYEKEKMQCNTLATCFKVCNRRPVEPDSLRENSLTYSSFNPGRFYVFPRDRIKPVDQGIIDFYQCQSPLKSTIYISLPGNCFSGKHTVHGNPGLS